MAIDDDQEHYLPDAPAGVGPILGGRLLKTTCECSDTTCTAHPGVAMCGALGLIILRCVDEPDGSGTLMCAQCRDRALDSGRFDAGRLGARPTR
jgi:hypothetical protein